MTMAEIWRPTHIPDYEVSNLGRVWSSKQGGRYLKQHDADSNRINQHSIVRLYRKGYSKPEVCRVHRLVLQAFIGDPPPDKPLIDHINGDTKDNRLINLKYVDHTENNRNMSKNRAGTSGILGVRYAERKDGGKLWIANIRPGRGQSRSFKYFHVETHGYEEAKRMAIEWRKSKEVEYGFTVYDENE